MAAMGQPRTFVAIQDRGRILRPRPLVLVAVGAVALLSLGLQVWGIMGDLPYAPDVDEPVFLQAAVRAVSHASLNPGWFGHPGSTTIYPIAALIEIWYLIAHHVPPFAHPMVSISREFASNPLPFYLIGRLVSVAYGVGSVVALWLLARRILGDVGGVIATLVLPATAIVVAYGHLTRTDTAALFFAIIALWLILRAMEVGRFRAWALAAAAIGLAVSSRYFFATLIVPYGVAAWLWLGASPGRPRIPKELRSRWMVPTGAVLLAPVAFLVTSPFVLLDLGRSVADIQHEARTVHPGADGLSPIGNLLWYLGDIVPATFSPGTHPAGDRRRHRPLAPQWASLGGARGIRGQLSRGCERLSAPLGSIRDPAGPHRRHRRGRRSPGDRRSGRALGRHHADAGIGRAIADERRGSHPDRLTAPADG